MGCSPYFGDYSGLSKDTSQLSPWSQGITLLYSGTQHEIGRPNGAGVPIHVTIILLDCILCDRVLSSFILGCKTICEPWIMGYGEWNNRHGLQMLDFSSALSLYFPWDFCLYPKATSLQMSAAQFLSPATVLVVIVVTLKVIKRRYTNCNMTKVHPFPQHTAIYEIPGMES